MAGRNMARRCASLAAVVAAAAVPLTACGSKAYAPLTQANFAAAISATTSEAKSVHMTISASSKLSIVADFNYVTPVAMQMTMLMPSDKGGSSVSLRVTGNAVYLQLPPATPAGKWLKTDGSTLGAGATQSYLAMGPQGLANQFKSGVRSVAYVGTVPVGNGAARHYTVVVDASQFGASLKALAAKVPALAKVSTVAEEVYLNDANVLERLTVTLPAPIGTMQVDFSNWDHVAAIVAPSARDLLSASGS